MRPYFERDSITLYHGDANEVLPELASQGERFGACITDPPWPGAHVPIVGGDRPFELLAEVAPLAFRLADRLVLQLGRDTDPRLLAAIPATLPFLCTCWMRYDVPGHKGRLLMSADVAFVFGPPPPSRPGGRVIPGEASGNAARARRRIAGHPCPRRLDHVKWLVRWFGGASVLDPFAGSGTTLLAALEHGVGAVGVEIEERFCEVAARRLAQRALFPPAPASPQSPHR